MNKIFYALCHLYRMYVDHYKNGYTANMDSGESTEITATRCKAKEKKNQEREKQKKSTERSHIFLHKKRLM